MYQLFLSCWSLKSLEISTVTVKADHFHNILFGGDQLTMDRARGAQHVRENSVDGVGRLEGLVPVCEDWHARVTLQSVTIYKHIELSSLPALECFMGVSTLMFVVVES